MLCAAGVEETHSGHPGGGAIYIILSGHICRVTFGSHLIFGVTDYIIKNVQFIHSVSK